MTNSRIGGRLLGFLTLAAILLSSLVIAQSQTQLRIASVSSPAHPHHAALEHFAELVEEKTDGQVTATVAHSSQLGGERDYIESMQLGTLHVAQVSTAPLTAFVPELKVFSLPYIFRDSEHFSNVLNGPVGEELFAEIEERGLIPLAWFDNGSRSVFNNVRPIETPEDLQGIKIRVLQDPIMVDTYNTLGASAVPMAYGEVYTALQQGVLDAAENAPWNVLAEKFYEVTDYFSLTETFAPPGVLLMSKQVYDSLPGDVQEALLEAGQETQEYVFQLIQEYAADSLDELREVGMEVNEVDTAPFREAVAPVYDQYADEIGADLIRRVQEAQ